VSISSDNHGDSTELSDGEYDSKHDSDVHMRREEDVEPLDCVELDGDADMETDVDNDEEEDERYADEEKEDEMEVEDEDEKED
jgi:hypothetical protein